MAIELNTPLNKPRAENIAYDDTFSNLTINPENVQEAIEKIDSRVDVAEAAIDQLKAGVNLTAIEELLDVDIIDLEEDDILQYDGTNWINVPLSSTSGATELNELNDVTLTSITANQVLEFNGTNWTNSTLTPPSTNLNALTDVTITSANLGQVLQYNGSEWINSLVSLSLNQLNNTNIVTPSTEQVLSYNGTTWVNRTLSNPSYIFNELTDVTLTSPVNNNVVVYDNASSNWVNKTFNQIGVSEIGHTHDTSSIISGVFSNARISQASVIQHQNALTITESQISNLQPYLTNINSQNINDLNDVTISNPSNGQVLGFNGTNWIPVTPSAAGSSALDDLTDVVISSVATDNYLKYNGTNWVNSNLPSIPTDLNSLTDTTISSPVNKNILIYDSGSSQWINNSFSTAGIAPTIHTHSTSDITSGTFADARISVSNVTQHQSALTITKSQVSDFGTYLTSSSNLNNLANVDTTTPSNGQVLTYATATNKWEPQTPSGSSIFSGANLIAASNVSTSNSTAGNVLLTWAAGSYDTDTYRDTVTNTKINLPTAGLYSISGRVGPTTAIATTSIWLIQTINFNTGHVLQTLGSQIGHAAAGTSNAVIFNQNFYTDAPLVINIRLQCYHSNVTTVTASAASTYIYITKLKDGVI